MIREGCPRGMGCVFVVFLKSPGGLEATKGPHSGARVSAAHHAAGTAARALRDKTDADRRHERQRATSMRTHVRRCVPPRGRPTTDDGRRRPNVHTRMQATPPHHPNSQPARRSATPWHDRRPPKIRAPASAEQPQRFDRQGLPMAGRSAAPTSGEHEELARAPAPPDKRRVSDAPRDKDRHSRRRNERRR